GREVLLRIERKRQPGVGVQAAFMEFIEQYRGHTLERGITLQHAREHALGHHLDARAPADARLEAHAVTHRVAHRLAQRAGHARRDGACRQAPRLEHDDPPVAQPRLIEHRNRHNGAFAGAGRSFEYRIAVALQDGAQLGQDSVDGKAGIHEGCDHTAEASANIRAMRWRQSRESQNVQDYRGQPTGRGGGGLKLGLGTIVLGVIAYFIGGPQLVMSLLSGTGSTPQTEEAIPTSHPGDEAGQFVTHILGDTEETWTAIFEQAGRQYDAPMLAIFSQG